VGEGKKRKEWGGEEERKGERAATVSSYRAAHIAATGRKGGRGGREFSRGKEREKMTTSVVTLSLRISSTSEIERAKRKHEGEILQKGKEGGMENTYRSSPEKRKGEGGKKEIDLYPQFCLSLLHVCTR